MATETKINKKAELGRPTKYNPKFCQKLIKMMKEGCSITEFCSEIEISRETFYQWIDEGSEFHQKEFSDIYKKARIHYEAWWERMGRENLWDETLCDDEGKRQVIKKFNHVLWYMNMKNRHGWKDKVEQELKGGITVTVAKDETEL